jgi:NodT family efflux transporter outer membrane factor (OMF) lipoprotein
MNKRIFLTLGLLALSACTAAEPHQDSGIRPPSLWVRLTGGGSHTVALDPKTTVEQQWWGHFNDPALDRLIHEALAGNKTLQIAKARVAEARADRKASLSILFPQVSGAADAARENEGYLFNKPVGVLDADIQATWELDLFGENQARAGAAQAIVESVEANRQGAAVTLLSDVARNYFDYRNQDRQLVITEANLADQQKTLQVTREQFQGGELSDFDVQRATAQVASTQAELPTLRTQRDAALNALSVLTGKPPGFVDMELQRLPPLSPLDPQIIVSAPADVLATRPDVKAAERQFASTISLRKAATRELFPTISLSALYGVQDTSLLIARPWTLAAGLTQPILNFGAITSQIDAADARQKQAYLTYQETVLEALQDMENALSAYGNEAERNDALQKSVDATVKAEQLARQRFNGGEIDLLDLLIAQRDTLTAQSALASSDSLLRQDMVHIYTAAGGGWAVGSR